MCIRDRSKIEGYLSGYTDNYIRIEIPYKENTLNTIKKLKLNEINENGLVLAEFAAETVH